MVMVRVKASEPAIQSCPSGRIFTGGKVPEARASPLFLSEFETYRCGKKMQKRKMKNRKRVPALMTRVVERVGRSPG